MHLKPRSYWCAHLETSQLSHFFQYNSQQVCIRFVWEDCYLLLQVYVMKNKIKWTLRAAGGSGGIRSSLYIRLKCNLNANCHIDAPGLWLPTGPCDGAECVFRLIASLRRWRCPGRSWSRRWQCLEGALLKTSREWCAYLRSKGIFTWFKIVSYPH